MLVYNGLPHLKEAIESILNQSYKNFEFLIIDDASPDKNIVKCIESYDDSRIRFIKNDKNLGVSITFNKALSLINTPYIIRADQDDISLSKRVEEQLNFLEKNPNISIVCSWEHVIDERGNRLYNATSSIKNYGAFLAPIFLGICPIWHPSIAFKKDSMINAGGFKKEFTRAEDFDVTARLAIKRYEARVLEKFHLLQRQHEASQSQEFSKEMAKMSNKIQEESISHFVEKKDAKKIAYFLRLNIDRNSNNFKSYIIEINTILKKLFDIVNSKQKMTSNEFSLFKKIILKRIGLGIKLLPYYSFFPSILFKIIFYFLSPLYLKNVYNTVSKIYNFIKKF